VIGQRITCQENAALQGQKILFNSTSEDSVALTGSHTGFKDGASKRSQLDVRVMWTSGAWQIPISG